MKKPLCTGPDGCWHALARHGPRGCTASCEVPGVGLYSCPCRRPNGEPLKLGQQSLNLKLPSGGKP